MTDYVKDGALVDLFTEAVPPVKASLVKQYCLRGDDAIVKSGMEVELKERGPSTRFARSGHSTHSDGAPFCRMACHERKKACPVDMLF